MLRLLKMKRMLKKEIKNQELERQYQLVGLTSINQQNGQFVPGVSFLRLGGNF